MPVSVSVKSVKAWPVQCQTYAYLPSPRASLPVVCTKLYYLVTGAAGCEQLAQSCYVAAPQPQVNPPPLDRESNAEPVAPLLHMVQ